MGINFISRRRTHSGLSAIKEVGKLKWSEVKRDKDVLLTFITIVSNNLASPVAHAITH